MHNVLNNNIKIRYRLWIDKNGNSFLGEGRIVLLQKIKEYGSISSAAKAIDISYRKAWQLVENMNRTSEKPLVIKKSGGKNGGSTVVTAEGERAVKEFSMLKQKMEIFLNESCNDLNF